jgi:hypothetical protein
MSAPPFAKTGRKGGPPATWCSLRLSIPHFGNSAVPQSDEMSALLLI